MRRTASVLALGLLAAGAVPALAGAPAQDAAAPAPGSVITDAANDANLLNGQGLSTIAGMRPAGTDTGPANYAGADLRTVRFETTFTRDTAGVATPTGLKVHLTTTGVPGSMAQTLIYRVSTSVSGCTGFIQAFVRGPASAPAPATPTADVAANTVQWRQTGTGCPAVVTRSVPAWTVAIDAPSKTLTMTLPFASMNEAEQALFLGTPATEEEPASPGVLGTPDVGVRTFNGTLTAPQIDEAPLGADFTVGSDIPAAG